MENSINEHRSSLLFASFFFLFFFIRSLLFVSYYFFFVFSSDPRIPSNFFPLSPPLIGRSLLMRSRQRDFSNIEHRPPSPTPSNNLSSYSHTYRSLIQQRNFASLRGIQSHCAPRCATSQDFYFEELRWTCTYIQYCKYIWCDSNFESVGRYFQKPALKRIYLYTIFGITYHTCKTGKNGRSKKIAEMISGKSY